MVTRMNIPTPYIFTIDTPLVMFKGRIFQPSKNTTEDDNYLEFSPIKYSLEEIVSAKSLEELYFSHNSEKFEEYQARYIRENIAKELRSSANVNQEITNNKVLSFIVNDVLPLITAEKMDNEIEDILVDDKDEQDKKHRRRQDSSRRTNQSSKDLEAEVQEQEIPISREVLAEARKLKSEFLKKLDQEYESFGKKKSRNSRTIDDKLGEILQNNTSSGRRATVMRRYSDFEDGSIFNKNVLSQNMMFIGESAYDLLTVKEFIQIFKEYIKPSLYRTLITFDSSKDPNEINDVIKRNILDIDKKCRSRIRNKLKTSKVKINGEYFIPLWKENSTQFRSDIINNYEKLIEKKIKVDSFDKYETQTRDIYEIAEERKRLHKLFDTNSYERKGAGFRIISGGYYVYVKTPAYALRSPHIRGSEKYVEFAPATIGVKIKYNGIGFEFGDPEIMHNYKHPFLGIASAHQKICLGERGSSAANRFKQLSPTQAVLSLLDQGKKTLMMGYKTGSNPYPSASLNETNGWHFITKEEVERRGLICLNEGW